MRTPQSINIILLLITAQAWTESLAGQAKLAAHAQSQVYMRRVQLHRLTAFRAYFKKAIILRLRACKKRPTHSATPERALQMRLFACEFVSQG